MRVLVFGATGLTGEKLVEYASWQGHLVTAFVRDPAHAPFEADVRVRAGDVTDPRAVANTIAGQDAVLCALGAATPIRRSPSLVEGVRHITSAMSASGLTRLVYLSFLGVPGGRHQLSALGRYVVAPILLHNIAADHAAKERLIRESGLDWTIVRPPRLTNGPRTGTTRHGEQIHARQVVPRVSRADVADLMVRALDDPASVHRALAILR